MLLAIDVGNTNIVFGLYRGDELLDVYRITTGTERSRDEYGLAFLGFFSFLSVSPGDIEDVIISSVVPPVMHSLERAVKKYIGKEPIIVDGHYPFEMNIKCTNPKEVGTDRLVNAVSAYTQYGGPLVIVDFGTATTFCAVAANGDYLGGAICPGIKISLEALFSETAKLPRIEIVRPKGIIGKDTVSAMQSGIFYGYVGQVDFIAEKMSRELGGAKVVATGGMSGMIASESRAISLVNGHLTLQGLKILYEKHL